MGDTEKLLNKISKVFQYIPLSDGPNAHMNDNEESRHVHSPEVESCISLSEGGRQALSKMTSFLPLFYHFVVGTVMLPKDCTGCLEVACL